MVDPSLKAILNLTPAMFTGLALLEILLSLNLNISTVTSFPAPPREM